MFAQCLMQRAVPRVGPSVRFTAAPRRVQRYSTKFGESEFAKERLHAEEHAAATTGLWKKISIWVCIPALVIAGGNAYMLWNAHWEHWSHMPPLEERTEYPYQNIRNKNYPWGDGDKTLFWNDETNHHNHDKVK